MCSFKWCLLVHFPFFFLKSETLGEHYYQKLSRITQWTEGFRKREWNYLCENEERVPDVRDSDRDRQYQEIEREREIERAIKRESENFG